MHVLVCYLNRLQNARCNDKDVFFNFLVHRIIFYEERRFGGGYASFFRQGKASNLMDPLDKLFLVTRPRK